MKNFFSFALLASALFLTSCGSDDDSTPTPSIDFPTTVTSQSIENLGDIMIFRKENGVVSEISADETTIDDDYDVTEIEASIDTLTFIDETTANYVTFGQELPVTYAISGEDLTFTVSPGFVVRGKGAPTDFNVESQLSIYESADGSSFSSAGAIRFSVASLQSDMADGDILLVMDYEERLAQ